MMFHQKITDPLHIILQAFDLCEKHELYHLVDLDRLGGGSRLL